MEKIGESLVVFSIAYIFIQLVYVIFINRKYMKVDDPKKIMEIGYLVGRFKINVKSINLKSTIQVTSIINSFIIAFTGAILSVLPLNIAWTMMIGFLLVLGLIYSIYEIYGRHLVRKIKNGR